MEPRRTCASPRGLNSKMAAFSDDEGETEKKTTSDVLFPTHKTKNKTKDRQERAKQKIEKRKARSLTRQKRKELEEALGDAAPPKQVPRTLENTREPDETMVDPDDEEVKFDEATDEMASYFSKQREPKILITSSENPHPKTIRFCRELNNVIPNSHYRFRCKTGVKKLCTAATDRGFTDIMIINEDRRMPNAILLIHLPKGPTAYFRLTNVRFRKSIKNCGELTSHRPELILNNFNTRLGHVTARMLASVFHFDPQFRGRSVVTFHNQRDFIFFRFHRYEFRNEKKVGLQELGPRFTLKLKSLQQGSFDSKFGEYEWILKRHEMETSRRRFFL